MKSLKEIELIIKNKNLLRIDEGCCYIQFENEKHPIKKGVEEIKYEVSKSVIFSYDNDEIKPFRYVKLYYNDKDYIDGYLTLEDIEDILGFEVNTVGMKKCFKNIDTINRFIKELQNQFEIEVYYSRRSIDTFLEFKVEDYNRLLEYLDFRSIDYENDYYKSLDEDEWKNLKEDSFENIVVRISDHKAHPCYDEFSKVNFRNDNHIDIYIWTLEVYYNLREKRL